MTNEEAIQLLKYIEILKFKDKSETYMFCDILDAFELAIKALEKDILKEPVQTHKRYGHGNEYDDYYCPECDKFLAYEPQGNRYKQEGGWSRCNNCGQKIIWEE